jgi:heme-degrading monooxygenase HmoA
LFLASLAFAEGVIVSVHIAELGPRAAAEMLLRPPQPGRVPGLTYAETTTIAALGEPLLPPRRLGPVGLIAAWEDDAALDRFSESHPHAARLADGWEVRLQPLRVSGSWAGMPGLPARALPVDDEEPVGILTLGRLRLLRTAAFRRSAAPAESEAIEDGALLAGTGLARPPRLVATFSLWRSAAAMRDYAYDQGGAHRAAIAAHRARPFHHESAFVRFRPYASAGSWNGGDPLAGSASAARAWKRGYP